MAESITIHANGKLLITGEYFVLDGASALAVPTKFGQSFEFTPIDQSAILWKGYTNEEDLWLNEVVTLPLTDKELPLDSHKGRLLQVVRSLSDLNPAIFNHGWQVTSKLGFPGDWGLGSSSTMIYALAKWGSVDPYALLSTTFGGSGYDVACGGAERPIRYTVHEREQTVNWEPVFSEQLYFVHLNQKQNSRDGIRHYRNMKLDKPSVIRELDALTTALMDCDELVAFEKLLTQHEAVVGHTLKLPLVRERLFSDYQGAVKSLGAWGGDFVLATGLISKGETINYFKQKGFQTILGWDDMVL